MKLFTEQSKMGKLFNGKFLRQIATNEPLHSILINNSNDYYEYRSKAIQKQIINPVPYPLSKELKNKIIKEMALAIQSYILSNKDYISFDFDFYDKKEKYDLLEAVTAMIER